MICHCQDNNPPVPAMAETQTTSTTFQVSNAKLYAQVATLFINDIKFLENIKQEFKRTYGIYGTNIDLK